MRLEPLQSGGGQERGLRSGTVPTPLAVGLGAACEVAQEEMEVSRAALSVGSVAHFVSARVSDVGLKSHEVTGCGSSGSEGFV